MALRLAMDWRIVGTAKLIGLRTQREPAQPATSKAPAEVGTRC